MTRYASTIALLGLICANGTAEAQLLRREDFTLSTGIVYYRTGDFAIPAVE